MKRSWEWFQERATSRHAQAWLIFFSFSDSSFFPVPPDFLLIALLSARVGRWVYYALITSVASLLGALFGYALGYFVFEPVAQPIIAFYGLTDAFNHVGALYTEGVFWVVLTAAFTPIPFKVFVLSGGFFQIPFLPFLIASTIGRTARFFLVSWISHTFGPRVAERFIDSFNFITVVAVILFAIALSVFFNLPELIW